MQSWVAEELKYTQLPDKRLNQRLVKIVEQAFAKPEATVPQASSNWTDTKATYDFWKSERFDYEDILEGHRFQTRQRALKEDVVLVVQDTSDFNFTHHKSKTWDKGFGQTGSQSYVRGLKVHSSLAVSSQGILLGVLDLQIWSREPKKLLEKEKKKSKVNTSILNKESKRWLRGLLDAELTLPSVKKIVTVTDREGDIFELFTLPRAENSELLIRGNHNRRVDNELKYLKKSMSKVESAGTLELVLPKKDGKSNRNATLTIRFSCVTIMAPASQKHRKESVKLNVITAVEENPVEGEKVINWLLLTTLPVNNCQEAVTCLRWYTYRWLIERYHYVLKSGCGVEKLQLETGERIKKALATYAIVAWKLLWLLYYSRDNSEECCQTIFHEDEWQSLYCYIHNDTNFPEKPPTIKKIIIWIASLGGFLGRKNDGEPGVKCLWRGIRRLSDITQTWILAKSLSRKVCET